MAGLTSPKPLITISVLTYNRCDLLRSVLGELVKLRYKPIEIILVDNCSTDGTRDMVITDFPQIKYLRTEKNLGAVGRNVGMEAATGEYVFTLDDDIDGLSDADIEAAVGRFEKDAKLGCINFRVVNLDGDICNWVHHRRVEDSFDKEFLTYEITEGAVVFRTQCLKKSGLYSPSFFLSHEGPDLAFRIFESGFDVSYAGEIAVRHHFAAASRDPWRNYYYDTRNQFWLAARNFPLSYAARYLGRGVLAMLFYSARDGYLRYWFKGVVDGLQGLRTTLKQRAVLSANTMGKLKDIDSHRPSLLYMIKKRVLGDGGVMLRS